MRVADIAYRLRVHGGAACPERRPIFGFVVQHLGQFSLSNRPALVRDSSLDRGPGIQLVVAGSPASISGLKTGDVLLRIGDVTPPVEEGLDRELDQKAAQGYRDRVDELFEQKARSGPIELQVLREGRIVAVRVTAVSGCPSRVHLARSGQRNAYADGTHVFITTQLLHTAANDDEVAFVIAHEMAHNILHHAANLHALGISHGKGRGTGRSGQAVIKKSEREADVLGAQLVRAAGFDPVKGAEVLRRVGGSIFGILGSGTHDSSSARISAIRRYVTSQLPNSGTRGDTGERGTGTP